MPNPIPHAVVEMLQDWTDALADAACDEELKEQMKQDLAKFSNKPKEPVVYDQNWNIEYIFLPSSMTPLSIPKSTKFLGLEYVMHGAIRLFILRNNAAPSKACLITWHQQGHLGTYPGKHIGSIATHGELKHVFIKWEKEQA
jgi:hypothetical protein